MRSLSCSLFTRFHDSTHLRVLALIVILFEATRRPTLNYAGPGDNPQRLRTIQAPHTEMLHITERLHRADLGHLEIEFTIEDPVAYSKPWVIKRVADLDTKDEIGEYVCIDRDAPHMVGK